MAGSDTPQTPSPHNRRHLKRRIGYTIATLMVALIVGVFRDGLSLYGLDNLWQQFTVGVLIIVAVTIDQWVRRISS